MVKVQQNAFKTKVGWWYWLVCYLMPTLGWFLSTFLDCYWLVSFLLWVVTIYMFSLTFLTRYVIEGENLTVFYGFFMKRHIPVSAITSIRPTRIPLSAPALSLRRLAISYYKHDEILVSPKDEEAFVATLKALNPHILTDER